MAASKPEPWNAVRRWRRACSYLKWPGLAQVMRRTCQRINFRTGQVERETRYGLTSLDRSLVGPRFIEYFWRHHWAIENGSHYVRDETLGEDRSQTHVGSAPRVLAAFRQRPDCVAPASRLVQHRRSTPPLRRITATRVAAYRLAGNMKQP